MADINFPKEYLTEAMSVVATLNDDRAQLQQYQETKKQLDPSMETLTRTIEKEKNDTVRSRRADIESNYDKQLKAVDSDINAINGRRQKARAEGVKTRVADNTAALRQQVEALHLQMKEYVKENNLPGALKSRAFYTLFSPISIWDWIIDILLAGICVAAIIVAYMKQVSLPVFLGVMAGVVLIVAVYIAISANVKGRHHEAVGICKSMFKEIAQKEKTIKAISRNIEKDKDDSFYNLGEYDQELQACSQKKNEINAQKTDALYQFDNNTKAVLVSEIDQKYAGQLEELTRSIAEAADSVSTFTQRVAMGEGRLNNEFVQYVGTKNLSHDRIEQMIGMIDSGEAVSVHDAASRVK